ncbi:MAG: P22 coat - protein 5 family protein [Gammaproteobacteria bacterium]|nr:P22 coat - protein 5 family protein [Gammaproteobacteria bacterium]
MANVLTDLAGDIYVAADRVAREQTGFLPAVTLNNNGSERAAIGDTVRSHFTRSATAGNRNVAMTVSEGTDQTVDNKTVTITKDRSVEIPWTGEDIKSLNNGSGFETIYGDQIAQAFRTLTGEMETDVYAAARVGASRAYGTAGTTPFQTSGDYTDASFVKKIIVDNGGAEAGNQLIINTTAGAYITGKQAAANVAGTDSIQRQGIILPLSGLDIRQSALIDAETKGTGAAYQTTAAFAVGATSITVDTGTGTVLAGDTITWAGDTNKYVVATALTGGTVVIAEPGLRETLADNVVLTVGADATPNICFARSAIELVSRAPSIPVIGGVARDSAVDRMMVADPISGIPFEISMYLGQGKAMIQVANAWGTKVWKPENVAVLLG